MKICVIGAGMMGRSHIRVLRSLGHIVLAVDPVEENRKKAVVESGAISAADDLEIYLANQKDLEIEAYVIATPTTTHYATAKRILENDRKPILIEKPICTTVQEAEEIRTLAKDTLVMVGHIEHYNPIVECNNCSKCISRRPYGCS